jgi:hypothetical protein
MAPPGGQERRRRLQEHERLRRQALAHLGGVGAVVLADADDLRRGEAGDAGVTVGGDLMKLHAVPYHGASTPGTDPQHGGRSTSRRR